MAIDAKMNFLGQIERKFATLITMDDMTKCMSVISDVLESFDMRLCKRWGEEEKDDLLDSFISAMRVSGKSEKTIARYAYIIGKFMKFVKVSTRSVNPYHVRNWLAKEKERGIQDSTLEGNRQVLSSYFGWLHREGLIEKNPISNVGTIKCQKKQKQIYSDIDLELLNSHCKTLRDKVILHFLASTGCRISEMTSLNRDAVDLNKLECTVHGKGNKDRTVYLDAVTGMLLKQYLNGRKDKCEAMFVGCRFERLEPGGVRCMMKELGKASGVEHVHPHKFRRTLATELTRHGMPIQEVANILGHEKLDTTMRYVVLNNESVKASYRKYA